MNILLYYFDKLTAWLDFSWFITKEEKPPPYRFEPLLN